MLRALDTSYVTERVLDVERRDMSFTLVERELERPLRKRYPLDPAEATHVALVEGRVAGVLGLEPEHWNGRLRIEHLYVEPGSRRLGVGRALLAAAEAEARRIGARVLWCETQNVNPDAIAFYRRNAFVLAGLDTSLYDPNATPGETAVFLARDVDGPSA